MPLITTITEFKKYVAIDGNTKIGTLTPFINEAEELYIIPLLGKAFYDEFVLAYTASVPPTTPIVPLDADNAALLPYIQRALAYYAQLLAIPHLAITFGDMGIRQHTDLDSQAAPRWLQEKLQFNALKNGDTHADGLLTFLEENATLTPTPKYGAWYSSSANTKNSGYIVYGTAIASRYIDISNSRRVFLQIRNKIREIETRIIPKLIGKAQYDDLVNNIQANTISAEYQRLLEKLEPIISKRALFLQLPAMRVTVNAHGIFVYSGTDDIFKLGQLASDADIKILRQQLMDGEGLGYLSDEKELNQFILDNIVDYPLIAASTAYTVQPDPGPMWDTKNDPCSKHFGV